MTKLEIYNIALSQHAKKCTQTEIESLNPPTEVEACNTMFNLAVSDVLGEYDWSYFLAPIELDLSDDEPSGNWKHGFFMPYSVARIAKVSASHKPYLVAGNRYYTQEDAPKGLWGIKWTAADMENAPADICNLVGLWLGYLISTILSPSDNNLANRILQNYSAHLATVMHHEINSCQDNYLDPDDWSAKQ